MNVPRQRRPVRQWVSQYTINATRRDLVGAFDVTVDLAGGGLWAVRFDRYCLSSDGHWDWEPPSAGRTPAWLGQHRHDLPAALALATVAAPDVTVSGRRAGGRP